MSGIRNSNCAGFTLIETIISMFVMALVITGGLVGLSQANLLSEKSNKQSTADFLLRVETEHLRSMNWSEIESLATTIAAYKDSSGGKPYNVLKTVSPTELSDLQITAEIKSDNYGNSANNGKKVFHLSLLWNDRTGRDHTETRVFILTEGGLSADS